MAIRRRLIWTGSGGVIRFDDVIVRLHKTPVIDDLGNFEALAYAPGRGAVKYPGEPARHLRPEERHACRSILIQLEAAVRDVLDGGSTIVVVTEGKA